MQKHHQDQPLVIIVPQFSLEKSKSMWIMVGLKMNAQQRGAEIIKASVVQKAVEHPTRFGDIFNAAILNESPIPK